MIVHVVMGNDFPEAVYKTERAAERLIIRKKGEEAKETGRDGLRRRIHWRTYAFELRE